MAIGDGVATGENGTALSGGQVFMKWSLIFINVVFLVFGIVLIALGATAIKNLAGQLSSNTLPDGIIVMGVFILLVSFFGFFSAWKEWRPGLGIYFGIVLLLSIILIAVSIAAYVEKNQANYLITQGWNNGGLDIQLSAMQAENCCGLATSDASSFSNYCTQGTITAPLYTGNSPPAVPAACCVAMNATYSVPNLSPTTCLNPLVSQFNSYVVPAASAGIAFSVLMMVALVFIGLLMKGIRLKNLNLEVLKSRQRNDAERAERRKGIQLPDNVL